MATLNPLLGALRESQDFQVIMTELIKSRPVIPNYTPQKTIDETAQLLETLKHNSSMRQGWDVLFIALTGRSP